MEGVVVAPRAAAPFEGCRGVVVAPRAAPAEPFTGGNLCVLDRLGCKDRDASLGWCEFALVGIDQRADGTVALSPGGALPLAHHLCEGGCPARRAAAPAAAVAADARAAPALLLGACVLVVAAGRVLLTRRAARMRTFAGAWVPPGARPARSVAPRPPPDARARA